MTVLRAPGKRLTKGYSRERDGRVTKTSYDKAFEFRTTVREFVGIDGLAELLRELQGRTDCCVIRAVPGRWHPGAGRAVLRRDHAHLELADDRGRFQPYARKGGEAARQEQEIAAGRLWPVTVLPMLEEQPTDWVLLDFENVTLPAGLDWRADLAYTAAFLRQKLPVAFHPARAVYYATASAADPSKPDLGGAEIRMRLGFVLDRGVTFAEAKRWLAGTDGLDDCTLRPVQITYTATPVFRGGLQDPMPERLGVLEGAIERVPVPRDLAPRSTTKRERLRSNEPARSAEGLGLLPSPGMDAALERLAELGGASGGVRSILVRAIFAYVRDVGRDRVDIDALAAALAAAAAPYRTAGEIEGYGLESLIAWSLDQAPPDPPPAPPPPRPGRLPAEEAAKKLAAAVADAVGRGAAWKAAGGADSGQPPPRIGIRADAGLGKTGAVLAQIAALPDAAGRNVEVYVPDHTLGEELAQRARAALPGCRVLVVRGRGAALADGTPLCAKAELAEQVARAGLSPMSHLCRLKMDDGSEDRCEHYDVCPYIAQFRDDRPAIRVLAHAALFTPRNRMLPEPDLVVIDESFWRGGVVHQRLALDRLGEVERWRVRPRKGEPRGVVEDRTLEAEDCARRVQSALRDGRDPRGVSTAEECSELAAIEWGSRTGPGITPGQAYAFQRTIWRGWRKSEAAKAGRFWGLLEEEHARPGRPMQRIVVERDAATADGERRHVLHLHHRRDLQLPAAPLILLDAGLEQDIAAKFVPGLEVVEIRVQHRARIVQVADKTVSHRFLAGAAEGDEREQRRAQRRRNELQSTAQRLLGNNGLLVTYKDIVDQIEVPAGSSKVHLGNLRGRDGFKGHDTVIVAGRLEPAPLALEALLRGVFGDDEQPLALIQPDDAGQVRYPRQERRCRMADGSAGHAVSVSVHPDPRGQHLLEQVREREVEQAVARLRLVHREKPATVYLLTNLPLDQEIDTVTTWTALARDRAAEAAHRWRGVWLASYAERARCAPDLWPTAGAARQDELLKKGVGSALKNTLIAVPTPFPQPPGWTLSGGPDVVTLVEYRHPGQRGSPHRALVPGDWYCPEAAQLTLEDVTGPVAKLRIVGTIHRDRPGVLLAAGEPPLLEVKLPASAATPAELPCPIVASRGRWQLNAKPRSAGEPRTVPLPLSMLMTGPPRWPPGPEGRPVPNGPSP